MNYVINGRYELINCVGDGKYSNCFECIDLQKSETVCLKVFSTNNVYFTNKSKFWNEVNTMQSISHCNVLKVIDAYADMVVDNNHGIPLRENIIVLEYCKNGDLYTYLDKTGILSEQQYLKFMHQILSGISALHNNGVCHRDVKPENILLDADLNLKIADFGYARFFDTTSPSPKFTLPCGTRQYIAPEVILSAGKFQYDGKKADMWSVGCVCFILAFGHPPVNFAASLDPYFAYLKERNNAFFWSYHLSKIKHYVSGSTVHLLSRMLTPLPQYRADAQELLDFQSFWYYEKEEHLEEIKTENVKCNCCCVM